MVREGNEITARELELVADNEVSLYPQKQSIEENLRRKVLAGKYDREKAVKLWMYWVDNAAKFYTKRHGGSRDKWSDSFDKPTREIVARSERDAWEEENLKRLQAEARAKAKSSPKKKTAKKKAPVARSLPVGNQREADDLELWADNTSSLYPAKQAIEGVLAKRVLAGKYDSKKAVDTWMYWVDEAAKRYAKEQRMPDWQRRSKYDKPTREIVARSERDAWEAEYLKGLQAEARAKAKAKLKPKAASTTSGSKIRRARSQAVRRGDPTDPEFIKSVEDYGDRMVGKMQAEGVTKLTAATIKKTFKGTAAAPFNEMIARELMRRGLKNPMTEHRQIWLRKYAQLPAKAPSKTVRAKIDKTSQPWSATQKGDSWYIVSGSKSKRIGPVTGRGINYYDRAVEEAERRNRFANPGAALKKAKVEKEGVQTRADEKRTEEAIARELNAIAKLKGR